MARFESPVISSASVAVASLSFFRPWIEFAVGNGVETPLGRSGADLARELYGTIPWLYITPASLLAILAISSVLLFKQSRRSRLIGNAINLALAILNIAWPLLAVARVTSNLSRFSAAGFTSTGLTGWWWLYCLSLGFIIVSAIIELVMSLRNRPGR
jgi:hypothetical protein